MVSAAAIGGAYLALLLAERGAEMWLSARNARRLLRRGGVEAGRGHWPVMVVFHGLFIAACAGEPLAFRAPWPVGASVAALIPALGAQALRWWAIASLGERWSARVVVLPGAALVTRGPYRWLRHPNYLAVAVELLAGPLVLGAWRTAVAFSAGNAILLAVRIRTEEAALGTAWKVAFVGRPRLVPAVRARAEATTSASASTPTATSTSTATSTPTLDIHETWAQEDAP
jgi:methyltransferase